MIENKRLLRRVVIITSLAIASFLGLYIWPTFVVPELLRIPKDFAYTADLISIDNLYDESTGQFSGERYSNSSFSYKILSYEGNIVEVQNTFEVESFEGKKIFASKPIYGIDAKTWMHIKGQGDKDREGYLFAPRGLKKDQTFKFWYVSTSVGADMKFVSEEDLYGLKVYKYEKTNLDPVDQSEFFSYMNGIPEKKGIMLANRLYVWIEPVSGYVVKQEEFSDDYYFFDRQTGKRLNPYNKYSNIYSEKSIIEHVDKARSSKYKVLAITYGIPLLVFLIIFLPIILSYSVISKKEKIKLFGLLIALFLIIITGIATYFVNKSVTDSESRILSDQADEVYLQVERGLASYIDILRGAQGLFNSSNFVDRQEWSSYISNLDLQKKYPGVLSMGYASVVDQDKKDIFVESVQKNDLKDFNIFPEKVTSHYVPILYIEPQIERNTNVIGYNFYSDENRGDALDRSLRSKDLAVTSKIELLGEKSSDKQPGFVMYLPIFRKPNHFSDSDFTKQEITGYVFAAFRMDDLVRNLVRTKKIDLCFHIYDGLREIPSTLIFDYDPGVLEDIKTIFLRRDVLRIGDRVWGIKFYNDPSFQIEKTKKMLPEVIFFGGIIFSILFYIIFYFLITTKERAVEIANKLTEEIREKENILSEKNKTMEDQILESNKLNQLMVDRELAMIELKKKMK